MKKFFGEFKEFISRGNVLSLDGPDIPLEDQQFDVDICWLREQPLQVGRRYTLRHATQEVTGIVKSILYKIDIDTQERRDGIDSLGMNDIARIRIKTAEPLVYDPYRKNRVMGSLVFIDDNNDTVGAAMIR